MDSVTLRKTHFKLGDYVNPYQTSNMEQSRNIQSAGYRAVSLDQNVKNELRKSHFIFGNNEPNYNTTSNQTYYDKTKIFNAQNVDFHGVERGLRKHNYVLGDDKPDYQSETQDKFKIPAVNPNDLVGQKVSTAQLQQSHHVFGNCSDPWVTTQQVSFGPKKVEQKYYTKNLTKTNFILGDAEPTLKSVNQETFIKHPIISNQANKELANDLRKHHFNFGNENYPDQLKTTNLQTYQDPKLKNEANSLKRLDPQFLRESHWSLGNPQQQTPDHFTTTYSSSMKPKVPIPNPRAPNTSFSSTINLNGKGPISYSTESGSNYIPYTKQINPNDLKAIKDSMKNIKSSHFQLGEMKNDYGTTSQLTYKFDPKAAGNAKSTLDNKLINDLRSTHYKLGYMPEVYQTTNRAAFAPINIYKFVKAKEPHLQENHFSFSSHGNEIQDGKTIYMTDYVKKPLPVED